MVMVLSVVLELSRCLMTGASSATSVLLPWDTVWPLSPALTVMSPSSRYHSAANAVTDRFTTSSSAMIAEISLLIFIGCTFSFLVLTRTPSGRQPGDCIGVPHCELPEGYSVHIPMITDKVFPVKHPPGGHFLPRLCR